MILFQGKRCCFKGVILQAMSTHLTGTNYFNGANSQVFGSEILFITHNSIYSFSDLKLQVHLYSFINYYINYILIGIKSLKLNAFNQVCQLASTRPQPQIYWGHIHRWSDLTSAWQHFGFQDHKALRKQLTLRPEMHSIKATQKLHKSKSTSNP